MLHDPNRLLVIAGPCSLEGEKTCRAVAKKLSDLRDKFPALNLVFKGSFDKANRTSAKGPRGTGMAAGLKLLALIKRDYGFPVLTDVHEREQMKAVAAVCDVIQIPAFLSRQTDLLLAAAKTGRIVNVKKGQFLSPQEMVHVTGKLREGKAREIWQTERGTTFGYQNLVVDMRSFAIMKQNGFPTVFDATHSVQLPGGQGTTSGGQREFVPVLARAAVAVGISGLFMETHPCPEKAWSDGPNSWPLARMESLLKTLLALDKAVKASGFEEMK